MPDAEGWLTKSEVNDLYYNAVGGEIVFGTEAQANLHAEAVARLLSVHAARLGRSQIRILELGANNAAFARSLLERLRQFGQTGESALSRVDYLAVEYALRSLEAAVEWEMAYGGGSVILRPETGPPGLPSSEPGRPNLVALLTSQGRPSTNLGLVHAEAARFVEVTRELFDVVILNELLDDQPWSVVYADPRGRRHEVTAFARKDGLAWTVRVDARRSDRAGSSRMRASTLTACSPYTARLVAGIERLLRSQGLLVVHDYGFAGPFAELATYQSLPRQVPSFATLELPEVSGQVFPRSFFRVFGNELRRLIQITNDVNFSEVAGPLRSKGAVVTLPHGNAIANDPAFVAFGADDGVFLSEFCLLRPGDDVPALLARLEGEQERLRERYIRNHMGGRESVFMDLVYLKP